MKALLFTLSTVLFTNLVYAKSVENCYKMALRVPKTVAQEKTILVPIAGSFCITENTVWATTSVDYISEGYAIFKIKSANGKTKAFYEMKFAAGDGAAGTYYNTYSNKFERLIDAEAGTHEEIVVITNAAASEADPNYFGRVQLFENTELILTKK